jgi:hypothetical protein
MAHIASTVNDRGHRRSASNLALRRPAGDSERWRGAGLGAVVLYFSYKT